MIFLLTRNLATSAAGVARVVRGGEGEARRIFGDTGLVRFAGHGIAVDANLRRRAAGQLPAQHDLGAEHDLIRPVKLDDLRRLRLVRHLIVSRSTRTPEPAASAPKARGWT
jgi:hypothetical protein